MVDVQIGECPPPLGYKIDEVLEHLFFAFAVGGPQRAVLGRSTSTPDAIAEQVLETAIGLEVRMSFEIEPDVSRRGPGQELESAAGLGREQLDAMLACAPEGELERGLLAELVEYL